MAKPSVAYKTIKLVDSDLVAVVDRRDYFWLKAFKRRADSYKLTTGKTVTYAVTSVGSMHRLIMGMPGRRPVDHKEGDGLNNRRSNLRIATPRKNQQNHRHLRAKKTCIYKGVDKHKVKKYRTRPWRARIRAGERQADGRARKLELGHFADPRDAALVYDEAARVYFGEYAATNEMLGLL